MKRITLMAATLLSLLFSLNAHAVLRFVEGEHYVKVAQTASSKPQVTEFFSFYCPHCYRFERTLEMIEQDLPAGVSVVKNHVDGTPLAPLDIQKSLTLGLSLANKMKMAKPISAAIFAENHVKKNKILKVEQLKSLFADNGIDDKKFDRAIKSPVIKGAAKRMRNQWNALPTDIRRIGVPALVINQKYWINLSSLNTRDDYKDLIAYLLTQK